MKALFRLIVVVLLLAGWTVAALSLHVVRGRDAATGKDRWIVVPKSRLAFADTYIDVRAWTAADAEARPILVQRLREAGKADALAPATAPATGPSE
jgi:hypothetical protein